jgi:D-lyxose ketol-isomerase
MTTPAHAHAEKKEDIICRWGKLAVRVWAREPALSGATSFTLPVNHEDQAITSGSTIELDAGWRVTLIPRRLSRVLSPVRRVHNCEVSTANDDLHDNFFVDPRVGRYPEIEEDEPPILRLISEK